MLNFVLANKADFQLVFGLLLSVVMLWRGGGPERAAALIWLVLLIGMDKLYHLIFSELYQLRGVDAFHAGLDTTMALLAAFFAIYANRTWPLWFAGFQLISVFGHIARELTEAMSPVTYAIVTIAPSWGMLAAMAGGFVQHRKRLGRFGPYRDWREPVPTVLEALSPSVIRNRRIGFEPS